MKYLVVSLAITIIFNGHAVDPTFVGPKPNQRIVAIGDLHGDYEATLETLKRAKIIDQKTHNWISADSILVQLGDILDRGEGEQEILELFYKLKSQAQKKGGEVYLLLGNHEFLNVQMDFRFVFPKEAWSDFDGFDDENAKRVHERKLLDDNPKIKYLLADHSKEHSESFYREILGEKFSFLHGRVINFFPGNKWAKKFALQNTIMVVGDSLFVHGGLAPWHLYYGLKGHKKLRDDFEKQFLSTRHTPSVPKLVKKRFAGIKNINLAIQKWMAGVSRPPIDLVDDKMYSPVWNRYLSHKIVPKEMSCQLAKVIVEALGIKRIVVGHTPQKEKGVNSICDGKVWRVDAANPSYYQEGAKHRFTSLQIIGNQTTVLGK